MLALVVLAFLAVAAFLGWQALSPRRAWQMTKAWRYRDPEANEPSDAAYGLQQVGAVIGAVLVGGVGIWMAFEAVDMGSTDRAMTRCVELVEALEPVWRSDGRADRPAIVAVAADQGGFDVQFDHDPILGDEVTIDVGSGVELVARTRAFGVAPMYCAS